MTVAADAPPRLPRQMPDGARRSRVRWLKRLVALACVLPVARMAIGLAGDHLGPNPIAEVLNRLGFWTLLLLVASLAATPARLLTGWAWPIALRKLLGLAAFFYGAMHVAVYVGVDQFFDFGEIWGDIVKRKFITAGLVAFLMLVPLAITSTAKMTKRLGARRWKRLHRLVYPAAILGVLHFAWRVKSDYRQPIVFATILGLLLAVRLIDAWRRRGRTSSPG